MEPFLPQASLEPTPPSSRSNRCQSDFINNNPHEILGEIFYHCTRLCADAPLALSCVSPLFRHIVVTTPRIWTRLRLKLSLFGEENEQACVRKLEQWLERAGTCTLDIFLDLSRLQPNPLGPLGTMTVNGGLGQLPAPALCALLQRHLSRIGSFALRTNTEAEARSFFSSMCTIKAPRDSNQALPLQKLTFHVLNSSAAPTPGILAPQSRGSGLCVLPELASVRLTNTTLPFLPTMNMHTIHIITITRPLRAQPLHAQAISLLWRSTPNLTRFELDSRVDTSPLPPDVDLALDADAEDDGHGDQQQSTGTNALIILPSLRHLNLRGNNLPVLLDHLVLPDLRTLRLCDIDGKRPGGSVEMAQALRQVLVRMDLPNEQPEMGGVEGEGKLGVNGLDSVEFENMGIGRDEGGLWEWCFRRMRALKKVGILGVGVNLSEMLEVLMAVRGGEVPIGTEPEEEDCVCPLLQHLLVPRSQADMCPAVERFAFARPGVHVEAAMDSVPSPILPVEDPVYFPAGSPRQPSGFGGGFGFGSRFDMARRGSMQGKKAENKAPALRVKWDEDEW